MTFFSLCALLPSAAAANAFVESAAIVSAATPGKQGGSPDTAAAFCSQAADVSKISDIMPRPATLPKDMSDIDILATLYAGLSLNDISVESLLASVSKDNLESAKLFAAHVREGNLVSAQMVLSLSPLGLQRSQFGMLSKRFLESAYLPFMEINDADDEDLNRQLKESQNQLRAGTKALGDAAESAFARWHIQAKVYYDKPASAATRDALCANRGHRALIPAVLRGLKAAK